jgi:hypothetical protein
MTFSSWARFLAATILVLGAGACATLDGGLASTGAAAKPESFLAADPCETAASAAEQRLYRLLMEHRRSQGLPAIPWSASLSYVARAHVRDLQAHPPSGKCNFHSWSADGPEPLLLYGRPCPGAVHVGQAQELTRYPKRV